jgi:hypothetical protein
MAFPVDSVSPNLLRWGKAGNDPLTAILELLLVSCLIVLGLVSKPPSGGGP